MKTNYSDLEKEFIKELLKTQNRTISFAEILTNGGFLENKGLAYLTIGDIAITFVNKEKYPTDDSQRDALIYILIIINLISELTDNKLIFLTNYNVNATFIGVKKFKQDKDSSFIIIGKDEKVTNDCRWINSDGEDVCICYKENISFLNLPLLNKYYYLSQDLIALVKNDFKTIEEKRFNKQYLTTLVGIGSAFFLGIIPTILNRCDIKNQAITINEQNKMLTKSIDKISRTIAIESSTSSFHKKEQNIVKRNRTK